MKSWKINFGKQFLNGKRNFNEINELWQEYIFLFNSTPSCVWIFTLTLCLLRVTVTFEIVQFDNFNRFGYNDVTATSCAWNIRVQLINCRYDARTCCATERTRVGSINNGISTRHISERLSVRVGPFNATSIEPFPGQFNGRFRNNWIGLFFRRRPRPRPRPRRWRWRHGRALNT